MQVVLGEEEGVCDEEWLGISDKFTAGGIAEAVFKIVEVDTLARAQARHYILLAELVVVEVLHLLRGRADGIAPIVDIFLEVGKVGSAGAATVIAMRRGTDADVRVAMPI